MRRNLLAFASVLALTAGLGAALNGCDALDSSCPPVLPRPGAQAPLPRLLIRSYDARGNPAQLPVAPESGSLEVTGDTVIILCTQAGVQHRVVYDVTGTTLRR
jgi:hypothetical protein